MTKKETLRSKKFLVDSDSENEHEEQDENEDIQPVVMLQNIIPANTKIITSHNCMSDIFTYEKADVHVIKDEKGDYYYKAKSIAKILGYADCKKAISRHVDKEYKKSYAELGGPPQTIYIDDCAFLQLVARSKMPQAVSFWRKITKEILPTLFRTGTYTMGITEIDIERLNKNLYDDNSLRKWENKNCIYLAYIGYNDEKYLLKFGESYDFPRRELIDHRNDYEIFNVLKIWEVSSSKLAESKIKTDFIGKKMLITCKIKNKNKKIKTK
jgi:prophage antirepressor-like protein